MKKIIMMLLIYSNLLFSFEIKTVAQESMPKFYEKNGKIVGICVDIMREIEKIDKSIKFIGDQKFIPFNRIELYLENGTLDCFVGMIKNDERSAKYVYIDIPVYFVKNVLVTQKLDDIVIRKLDDIKKLKDNLILMTLGLGQTDKLKENNFNIDDGGKTLEANLLKLLDGRGRFVYQSEIEIKNAIADLGIQDKVKIQPLEDEISGRYIVFSKKTPKEIIVKVTKALEILKKNGKLDEIFRNYVD